MSNPRPTPETKTVDEMAEVVAAFKRALKTRPSPNGDYRDPLSGLTFGMSPRDAKRRLEILTFLDGGEVVFQNDVAMIINKKQKGENEK